MISVSLSFSAFRVRIGRDAFTSCFQAFGRSFVMHTRLSLIDLRGTASLRGMAGVRE